MRAISHIPWASVFVIIRHESNLTHTLSVFMIIRHDSNLTRTSSVFIITRWERSHTYLESVFIMRRAISHVPWESAFMITRHDSNLTRTLSVFMIIRHDSNRTRTLTPSLRRPCIHAIFFSTACRTAYKHAFRFLRVFPEAMSTRHCVAVTNVGWRVYTRPVSGVW